MSKTVIISGMSALDDGNVGCGAARLICDDVTVVTILYKSRKTNNFGCALKTVLEIIKSSADSSEIELLQQSSLGFAHPDKSVNKSLINEIIHLAPSIKPTVKTGICREFVQEIKPFFSQIPFDKLHYLKGDEQICQDPISRESAQVKSQVKKQPPITKTYIEPKHSHEEENLRMTTDGWKSRKMWIDDRRLQVIIATFEKLDEERREKLLDYARSLRRPEDGNINKP